MELIRVDFGRDKVYVVLDWVQDRVWFPWSLDALHGRQRASRRTICDNPPSTHRSRPRRLLETSGLRIRAVNRSKITRILTILQRFWIERLQRPKTRPETSPDTFFNRFYIGYRRSDSMVRFGEPWKKRHWGSSRIPPPLRHFSPKFSSYITFLIFFNFWFPFGIYYVPNRVFAMTKTVFGYKFQDFLSKKSVFAF